MAAIALREAPGIPKYPTLNELRNWWGQPADPDGYAVLVAMFLSGDHPVLGGTYILDPGANSVSESTSGSGLVRCKGIPRNPWHPTAAIVQPSCFLDQSNEAPWTQGAHLGFGGQSGGYLYWAETGRVWAFSNANGGTACDESHVATGLVPKNPTENCY